jgi:hypothetical protein
MSVTGQTPVGGTEGPMRMSARAVLEERAKRLRYRANDLEKLIEIIPWDLLDAYPEAENALWAMMYVRDN